MRSEAVLSADRVGLMNRIRDASIIEARDLGIDIIDVRLKRADLPEQNLTATFERMKAEREREAADERARGNEAAQRVRAQADRTALEIVSEADRDGRVIRGEADAERNRILAEAYGADEEFFAFLRSMDAYKNALKGDNTTLMIEPDSEFFHYLRSPDPDGRAAPAHAAGPAPQAAEHAAWAPIDRRPAARPRLRRHRRGPRPRAGARPPRAGARPRRRAGPRAPAHARAARGDRRRRPCVVRPLVKNSCDKGGRIRPAGEGRRQHSSARRRHAVSRRGWRTRGGASRDWHSLTRGLACALALVRRRTAARRRTVAGRRRAPRR